MHFIILLALKVLLYESSFYQLNFAYKSYTNRGQMPNNEILLQQQP